MSFLHPIKPKTWKLQGYTQPLGIEIARNKTTIVIKTPGYSGNYSGVRGMPDMRYEPTTIVVWKILKHQSDGVLEVEQIISYPVAGNRKK